MSFTKEIVNQNQEMLTTAKRLLIKKNADVNTVPNQHQDIIDEMIKIYSNIPRVRVIYQISKALHQMNTKKSNRGGLRNPPGGRPPLPKDQKRRTFSVTLAPGTKELAQAIARILELPGGGHAIDEALVRMVEGDRELKIKLAEMGIIIKEKML